MEPVPSAVEWAKGFAKSTQGFIKSALHEDKEDARRDDPIHHLMDDEREVALCSKPRAKATLQLGSESFVVKVDNTGTLSQQLGTMKEQCMAILKDFITMNNAPNDVPDEPFEEGSSEDDEGTPNIPSKKIKK